MATISERLDRIHDALPDDGDLAYLGHEFIGLYVEYIERHGYEPERAEAAAIREVIEGVRAAVALREEAKEREQ